MYRVTEMYRGSTDGNKETTILETNTHIQVLNEPINSREFSLERKTIFGNRERLFTGTARECEEYYRKYLHPCRVITKERE